MTKKQKIAKEREDILDFMALHGRVSPKQLRQACKDGKIDADSFRIDSCLNRLWRDGKLSRPVFGIYTLSKPDQHKYNNGKQSPNTTTSPQPSEKLFIPNIPDSHIPRFRELKQQFKHVEPYPDHTNPNGFIVNGQFIVGAVKKRWRNKGYNKWYGFRDMEHLAGFVYGENSNSSSPSNPLEPRIEQFQQEVEREFNETDKQLQSHSKKLSILRTQNKKLLRRVKRLERQLEH